MEEKDKNRFKFLSQTFFLGWGFSCFFLLTTLINTLNIHFSTIASGAIREFKVNIVFFNPVLDKIIGFTFPIFLVILLLKKRSLSTEKSLQTFFTYLMLPMVFVEASSLFGWILDGFIHRFTVLHPKIGWYPSFIEVQFFNVFYPILAPLTLLALFSFILKLGFSFLSEKVSQENFFFSNLTSKFLLFISVLAGFFVCFYPLLPAVNPKQIVFGADIPPYRDVIEKLFSLGYLGMLKTPNAFFRERIVYHTFQYLIILLTPASITQTLQFTSTILAVLLVLAVYFFVRVGAKSDFTAGCSAFFTAFSFNVLAGLISAIYSNWFALVEVYIFLGLYLLAVEKKKKLFLVLSALVSVLILYTHSWTWSFIMVVLGLYFLLNLWYTKFEGLKSGREWELKALIFIFTINVFFNLLKKLCFSIPGGVEASYTVTSSFFDFSYLFLIREIIGETLKAKVGGFFANPLIYILSVIGVCFMSNHKNRFHQILFLWLMVGCGTFIFSGNLQWRVLYVIPFPIYSALGIIAILKLFNIKNKTLLLLLVYLAMANYGFRSAINIIPT